MKEVILYPHEIEQACMDYIVRNKSKGLTPSELIVIEDGDCSIKIHIQGQTTDEFGKKLVVIEDDLKCARITFDLDN